MADQGKSSILTKAIAIAVLGAPLVLYLQLRDASKASVPPSATPGAIYASLPGNIACPTEDLLVVAIGRANAHDFGGLDQMTVEKGGGPCLIFPAG